MEGKQRRRLVLVVPNQRDTPFDASPDGDNGYGSMGSDVNSIPGSHPFGERHELVDNGQNVHLCDEVYPPSKEGWLPSSAALLPSDIGKPIEEGYAKSVRATQTIPEITEIRKFIKWTPMPVQVSDVTNSINSSLILGISPSSNHRVKQNTGDHTSEAIVLFKYSIEETGRCQQDGGIGSLVVNSQFYRMPKESMIYSKACDGVVHTTSSSTLKNSTSAGNSAPVDQVDINFFSNEDCASKSMYGQMTKQYIALGQQCTSTGGTDQYIMGNFSPGGTCPSKLKPFTQATTMFEYSKDTKLLLECDGNSKPMPLPFLSNDRVETPMCLDCSDNTVPTLVWPSNHDT